MNRAEFLNELKFKLRGRNEREVNEVINYYEEIIYDKLESGHSESEIINSFGSIDKLKVLM